MRCLTRALLSSTAVAHGCVSERCKPTELPMRPEGWRRIAIMPIGCPIGRCSLNRCGRFSTRCRGMPCIHHIHTSILRGAPLPSYRVPLAPCPCPRSHACTSSVHIMRTRTHTLTPAVVHRNDHMGPWAGSLNRQPLPLPSTGIATPTYTGPRPPGAGLENEPHRAHHSPHPTSNACRPLASP